LEKPSTRTQFLIFTLFGEYVLPREGTIWTSSLLDLLGLLGISERATRSTLSRMTRKGWLVAQKHGRRSQYSLTPRGWMLITQGAERIFESPIADWNGFWHMVVYSLPEKKRRLRHNLRQRLSWYGFGSLAPGAWVSPHNRDAEVKNMCTELGIQKHVELFSCAHLGLSTDLDLVKRCWDIEALEADYRTFIARYQNEYRQCEPSHCTGSNHPDALPLSPENCFVRRFWLVHDFQSFPSKDPNLPLALLPPIRFAAHNCSKITALSAFKINSECHSDRSSQ
jgi:phenylacetic acid degradation operon negative regulatory protein